MNTTWKSAAGYVMGRSHEKEQKPCQDRTLTLKRDNISFIGLSDGAGSASHSELGAECTLAVVAEYCVQNFSHLLELDEQQINGLLLDEIHRGIGELASIHNLPMQAFASTLLFVVSNDKHYISGHIGDGLIVKYSDKLAIHSHADNGAYANVTYFTTSTDVKERFRIQKGLLETADETITSFCLMSDGTSSSLYRKQDNVIAPAIMTIASWLEQNDESTVCEAIVQNLQKSMRLKTFDDCSLAIMVKI